MSHGNLEGKVVEFDFWPSCENCRFYEACKKQPQHPAYPHSWHWGKECAAFADGYLITCSWVGTTAIGHAHTGCKGYQVDPRHVSEPQLHHRLFLELEYEKKRLDYAMETAERRTVWSQADKDTHAKLFTRYRQILKEQETLRATVEETRPRAAAVNE